MLNVEYIWMFDVGDFMVRLCDYLDIYGYYIVLDEVVFVVVVELV